ncbi:unnamed protein product [Pleuronectes platessa]|uniref:Uncharacterized protein n=1 Tax=Pleuronectes platessa TaxID=8262 RepID=A0A9N7U5Z1_PLEPL|nr:unnamed protein product [Pleuronectes platessa]
MLPLALFSTKVPVGERRALADAARHKPADLPMRAPQLCFGTGFSKLKFPTLSPTTSLADLANPECCESLAMTGSTSGWSPPRHLTQRLWKVGGALPVM